VRRTGWIATPNGALILLAFAVSAIQAQTTELDPFVEKDLWKDHLSKGDQARLHEIIGDVPKGYIMPPEPWHVWKTDRNGQTRYIVLLGEAEIIIPGGSTARIQLFDSAAKRINSWSFQTGWRITLDRASFEFSKDLDSDLIVLYTTPFINGRDVAKEIFAIRNDRLQFVRMEDAAGEAVQNDYVYPNWEIGMVPNARTVDEWAVMLESKDKSEVLSALTFLGGRHVTEPQRRFAPEPQEGKYGPLFQQVIEDQRIRLIIDRLSKSDNEWIRQAAVLAARAPRERLLR
jgi:hypothetical protein